MAEYNISDPLLNKQLREASQEGRNEEVSRLLLNGAHVHSTDKLGQSSLMWASERGHEEVVKTLLSAGAQVNLQNEYGESSLMLASKGGHDEVVKTLLSAGAQVHLQNKRGKSSLVLASDGGYEGTLRVLLSATDVNPQDETILLVQCKEAQLRIASEKGDIEMVTELLKNGVLVDAADKDGRSSLMLASKEGCEEVVKALLSAGARVNLQNKDGRSSLMLASEEGHQEVVKTLLSAGAQIHLQNKFGQSSLMLASKRGCEEVVKALLSAGAQVNLQDEDGLSSLMWASKGGHEEVVKTLLSAGAQVNLQDKDGKSSLVLASEGGHEGFLRVLLSATDVNPQDETMLLVQCKEAQLRIASEKGDIEMVTELLKNGVLVDAADKHGMSSLMWASWRGHEEVVKALLSAGAQVDLQDKTSGWSPLIWASNEGHEEVVKTLLLAGAQINLLDKVGRSSLMMASNEGHEVVVKTLLLDGAQVNLQNEVMTTSTKQRQDYKNGRSSLMLASDEGHDEVVRTLLPAGAQINLQDEFGWSSLMLASMEGHDEVVRTLLSAGAQVNLQDKEGGNTALHWATLWSRGGCVRLLLSAPGIDANLVNNEGQTALEVATRYEVLTMLQSYTNISKDFPVHTYGKVIVCGDSGAGKTTLTHAIMDWCKSTSKGSNMDQNLSNTRKFLTSKSMNVKPLTAGIIPHCVKSPKVNMTIYDLAGHREYYSSHSSILEHISSTTPSVFLLLVNLLLPLKEITSQLYYWSAMIGNVSNKCPQQSSIIVIGTHADCISDTRMLQFLSSQIEQVARDATRHHIFVQFSALDVSSFNEDLDSLMSLLSHTIDDVRVRCPAISLDCHMMYAFLNDNVPADQDTISLTELLVLLNQQTPQVLVPVSKEISKLLKTLSEKGFIVFFDTNLADSWIVIHQDALLEKVNGVLFAPQQFKEHLPIASNTGVIPITVLNKHFPEPKYNIDMMIQFLIRFELCQPISFVPANTSLKGSFAGSGPCLFFPPLVHDSRPNDVIIRQNAFFWMICAITINQSFSPRFFHVLINRITYTFPLPSTQPCLVPDLELYNQNCTVWSRGISWRSKEGFTSVIEISEDFQCLSYAVLASDRTDSSYLTLILKVINIIKVTCDEFCPLVSKVEVVMCPPEATSDHISAPVEYELLRDMLQRDKKTVTDRDGKKEVNIKEWLKVEPQLPSLLGVAKKGFNVDAECKTLGEDDLTDVMEEVVDLASRWKAFGLALRLRNADLETIASKNHHNPSDCLRDTLLHWLQCHYDTERFGPPSWKLLCKAVEARAGGDNPALAKHIQENNKN